MVGQWLVTCRQWGIHTFQHKYLQNIGMKVEGIKFAKSWPSGSIKRRILVRSAEVPIAEKKKMAGA
jgi:hypothetical protein